MPFIKQKYIGRGTTSFTGCSAFYLLSGFFLEEEEGESTETVIRVSLVDITPDRRVL